jgi:two-component system nitrate/nitrite response regulator NarL
MTTEGSTLEREPRADHPRPREVLTPREHEVLLELARGRTVPDIARDAVVSVATVRSQIRSLVAKLEVVDVDAAVALVVAAPVDGDVRGGSAGP